MISAARMNGVARTPMLQWRIPRLLLHRLVSVWYCGKFIICRSSSWSVTRRTPSTAGHGQVYRPQLWWLTVGLRAGARAERTAPMLIPDASISTPVGQFRYSRPEAIMMGTNIDPMITKNHG